MMKPTNSILGVCHGKVRLVPYTPAWKVLFGRERRRLTMVIGPYVEEIRHIGSTAVAGIYAKPIIDIMAGLTTLDDLTHCVPLLKQVGYTYQGEQDIPGWHFFTKDYGDLTTHHLHVVLWRSDYWNDHLLFQNYLAANREIARAYEELKLNLAQKYHDDRVAYTRSKTEFIMQMTEEARTWHQQPQIRESIKELTTSP